ncbi:ATP-binding protein [Candidatus Peregrinibacteria bacterium]|nr:ATP-binding protein [Candidatus Peregrinibacteria bacterium]
MSSTIKNLPITVEKSHLVTIGEKLYSEKIDFIRELVNNSYDADATIVQITCAADRILIEDNGSGMDEKGLLQYFTIGSEFKKEHRFSSRFRRERIGEFGIGKFAALAAAKSFIIETHRGEWSYRAVFSKKEWHEKNSWELPVEVLPKSPLRTDGTIITILNPDRSFDVKDIIRHLREKVPLGSESFQIFLNGKEILPYAIPGQRIPVNLKTKYGTVIGEIILVSPHIASIQKAGLEIRVKGIMIRRSIFGLESSKGIARIRGEVKADFLPITSNRDDFIRDDERYEFFTELIQREIRKALKKLSDIQMGKFNQQASHVLKEALTLVGKAIRKNPGMAEAIRKEAPLGQEIQSGEEVYGLSENSEKDLVEGFHVSRPTFEVPNDPSLFGNEPEKDHFGTLKRKPRMLALAEKTIIRRLRFKDFGIVCRMEHLGRDEEESLSSEGIIYLNIDHPLYHRFAREEKTLIFHIVRLIAQEMALSHTPKSPREAFELQSELMTESFGKRRHEETETTVEN